MLLPEDVLATGRNAEIYPWTHGRVLKLLHRGRSKRAAKREAHTVQAVRKSGVPAPKVEGTVQIDGRSGIILESLDGPPLADWLRRRPWAFFDGARQLADVHAQIHDTRCTDLPSQRDALRQRIAGVTELSESIRDRLLAALDGMPDGEQLCHGDFHPDNVLITDAGAVVIDWPDATRGNPIADVARTSLLLVESSLLRKARIMPEWFFRNGRKVFNRTYLNRYVQRRSFDRGELARWRPIIAAARLSENIPEERQPLVELIHRELR